jgi:signal transduction histidine kinase
MPFPRPRAPGWLRLPRRTARMRLTALYGAAFLVCGAGSAAVLGATFLLYWATTHLSNPPPAGQSSSPVLKTPITDVQRAGRYDLFKIPASAVQRQGRYDVLTAPAQALTDPAQQAHDPTSVVAQAKVTIVGLGQITIDQQQLLIASAISLAVIVVAAAAIGWLLAGRVLHPLRTITAAARRISASSLHERLALHGPDDELKELADTLDSLFARLEASFDAQRRFAANASHELLTPLTRERTLLQVTRADPASTTGTWQAVSRELLTSNAEQGRLIEALLTLASSERGVEQWEPFDLAEIAAKVIEDRGQEAGGRGLAVAATLAPAPATGDPSLAESLVANLMDNALRHNVTGGRIDVSTGMTAGRASVRVANTGPVIPADQLDRLFQPFQRLGRDRIGHAGGHGLGLPIVRAIAHAHAAALTARPRPEGGLDVEVSFP